MSWEPLTLYTFGSGEYNPVYWFGVPTRGGCCVEQGVTQEFLSGGAVVDSTNATHYRLRFEPATPWRSQDGSPVVSWSEVLAEVTDGIPSYTYFEKEEEMTASGSVWFTPQISKPEDPHPPSGFYGYAGPEWVYPTPVINAYYATGEWADYQEVAFPPANSYPQDYRSLYAEADFRNYYRRLKVEVVNTSFISAVVFTTDFPVTISWKQTEYDISGALVGTTNPIQVWDLDTPNSNIIEVTPPEEGGRYVLSNFVIQYTARIGQPVVRSDNVCD